MSLFRMPKGVKARLEKIQRDFLWGSGNLERKIHLINWNTVCSSKEKGGLGVRSLSTLDRALLDKWIWRFVVEEDSPWKNIISLKYDTKEGGWLTKNPRGSYRVDHWKDKQRVESGEAGLLLFSR